MRAITAVIPALILATAPIHGHRPAAAPLGRAAAEDLLAKSMAAYDKLTSYADSGTATRETSGELDVGHFRTYLRRPPLSFYFEWGRRVQISTKRPADSLSLGGKRQVFWLVNGDLQIYIKDGASAQHRTYPRETSNQPAALAGAKAGTMETITLIPSLLFGKANLVGPIQEIAEISLAGTEDVAGHHCHKLVGIAQSVYPSGAVTNVRPITVWIDTETLLVRKVFTDTPKGWDLNSVSRFTYTLDPVPNPKLDDATFQFTVPETQQ
jgi:outer membrane lipoprotein-sorting protein